MYKYRLLKFVSLGHEYGINGVIKRNERGKRKRERGTKRMYVCVCGEGGGGRLNLTLLYAELDNSVAVSCVL